ncbi:MAG TPA: type II and III secretion system protein family protein, partial [Planctomycetota bacterium]|nr:type II and III secretion system protein family protein [Planctomycetota bacterium]
MHHSTLRSTLVAALVTLGMLPCLAMDGSAQAKSQETVKLFVGRSHRITSPWDVAGVSLTDPAVADVQVLTPRLVMLSGRAVGTTDVVLWSDAGETTDLRLDVEIDLERLKEDMARMFPGATLDVQMSEGVLIVEGTLLKAYQADELHRYLEARDLPFMDRAALPGVQQVQAKIRFAEVSRTGLRKLGVSMFYANSGNAFGTLLSGSSEIGANDGGSFWEHILEPSIGADTATPSATLFGSLTDNADFHFFVDALAQNKYLRVLAEPTLVAMSGEEASFLAGGEFPVPVPQSGSATGAITIEYKQFGVALAFRPIVLGDGTIHLLVRSEVSQIDKANGIVSEGIQVPAITTRRSETTLELKSGQTFAMAGLLQRGTLGSRTQIPWLGDLPVLGPLFRSVSYESLESELVALVTVDLVEPSDSQVFPPLPGETHEAPGDWELYYEGKLEANTPGRLANSEGPYVNALGLQDLRGPGAWAYYGQE